MNFDEFVSCDQPFFSTEALKAKQLEGQLANVMKNYEQLSHDHQQLSHQHKTQTRHHKEESDEIKR